jgi:hypothetical protein
MLTGIPREVFPGERSEIAGKIRTHLDGIGDDVSPTHSRAPDSPHWA